MAIEYNPPHLGFEFPLFSKLSPKQKKVYVRGLRFSLHSKYMGILEEQWYVKVKTIAFYNRKIKLTSHERLRTKRKETKNYFIQRERSAYPHKLLCCAAYPCNILPCWPWTPLTRTDLNPDPLATRDNFVQLYVYNLTHYNGCQDFHPVRAQENHHMP